MDAGGDFGATRRLDVNETRFQTTQQQPPRQPPPPPPKKKGVPLWVWLGGGAALFFFIVVVAIVAFYFLFGQTGFTLVVRGAPPGSDIYVDNISRGVTSTDGSIKVPDLKSGKRVVRVSHDGYGDFNTSVSGQDGETKTIVAQLTATGTVKPPAGLAKEIDYNGAMMLVGQGEFVMGDDAHNPEEKPAHKVTLPDFYIDKFEVTNDQYKKFCDATKHEYPTNPWWDDHYFSNRPSAPVLGVSWDDASVYAKWANKRLPTEEEWEKAASWDPAAQKKRQWPWGDASESTRANVGGTQHTSDVGQFPTGASAYGVQDLAGNVAEWVDAFYQAYPGNQVASPDFGTKNRVVRGGTYKGSLDDARATRRLYHPPQLDESEKKNRAFLIGFRCAIAADDAKLKESLRAK
jgi:formylglycine-generating enzyme required for sulfatase activity